jgi:RHS repeat-associated protein
LFQHITLQVLFGFRNKNIQSARSTAFTVYDAWKSASGIHQRGDGFSVPSVILIAASSDVENRSLDGLRRQITRWRQAIRADKQSHRLPDPQVEQVVSVHFVRRKCMARFFASLCILVSLLCMSSAAQQPQYPYAGFPPFSTQTGSQYDLIDLADGNISLNLPLRAIQAGPMPLSFSLSGQSNAYVLYDGNYSWQITSPSFAGSPLSNVGASLGYYSSEPTTCNGNVDTLYTNFHVTDSYGTIHPLSTSIELDSGGCYQLPSPLVQLTTDDSGYSAVFSGTPGNWNAALYDKFGNTYGGSYTLSGDNQTYVNYVNTPDEVTAVTTTTVSGTGCAAWCTTVTDALTTTPAISYATAATNGGPVSYTYTNSQGNSINPPYTVTSSGYTLATKFGCSGISEVGPTPNVYLPTSITTPTGGTYAITYETTPGYSSKYTTGRIGSITLPYGGSISYAYAGGNNGINCESWVVPTLTRTVNDNNGGISKWTYVNSNASSSSDNNFTVVVTDPAGNQTAYSFQGQVQTQASSYQGGCPTGTTGCASGGILLKTVTTCYDGVFGNCAAPSSLIALPPYTQTDAYTSYNSGPTKDVETKFDTYGNPTEVKQYDFGVTMGAAPTATPLSDTLTYYGQSWNSSSGACNAYPSGIYIYATPCYTVTKSSGTTVAQTQVTYSNTGHPTTTSQWNGSAWLSSTATYNSNGTVATSTAVSGALSTYSYGDCNGLLPTSVVVTGTGLPSAGLTNSTQWNCSGAVVTETTDPNGASTTYTYNDPLWRITSTTDPLGNVTTDSYPSQTTSETAMNFNGSVSTSDKLVTTDGLGRQIFSQTRQGQGSSTFDTVQTTYGWTTPGGPFTKTSVPYPGTQAQTAPAGTGSNTTQDDAFNRAISISNSGGRVVSNTYSQNDVLSVLGPAPTGEHTKQTQTQYDGMGRVTSVCGIESSGGTTCGQVTGSLSGVVTTTAYASASGSQTVSSTRGSQSRSKTVDWLGRVTSVTTPEGGTWQYHYDSSYGSCPSGYTGAPGQLEASVDPDGNVLCYTYDALNRVKAINANGTTCRGFWYDSATEFPAGITIANGAGRMIEAYTWGCGETSIITDEWFSYDKDGRATTQWQSTPHSGAYYEAVASYTGPALTAVQLANPGLYTMTYGLDGEGRWSTLTDSTASQNIVTKTTFNAAGQPLNVQLTGTTPDQDIYTYDPNTGNMKTFEFEVGNTPANLTGKLSWNTNGALGQLAVTDGFNADGTETCYSNSSGSLGAGYDDLERLIEFDCGSGNWGQEFSYDQYDNLIKAVISGRTGTTWNPGYSTSPSNNHCNSPCTYDSNGNVTADGNDVYGWNEFSKIAWTAPSGTPECGSSGRCATYDAFGRMVEASVNSTWHTYWYAEVGKIVMTGTTILTGRWPTSSGTAETIGTSCCTYLHSDWLGNSRIVSSINNNTVSADQAYTPYGEIYNIFGANNGQYQVFAGTIADLGPSTTTPTMWDTPNRELSYVGRWLSPDPAGSGWNQYGYATNPNSNVDPTGLAQCSDQQNAAICQGGYYGGTGFFLNWTNWDEFDLVWTFASFDDNGERVGVWGFIAPPFSLASGYAANNSKLTPAQCKAAQTLLAREAQYGTTIAAATSAIGFGDNTVQPFNSSNTAPIDTPIGQIKIDWYTDIQATGPSFSFGVGNSIAYAEGKLIWTGLRLWTGAPITNYLPFTDPAELNTLQQTFSPFSHYSDIFTPAFMQQNCGPQ